MLFTHLAKTAHFCSLMDWFLTSWTLKITSLLYLNENQCYKGIDILDTCGAMICSYFGIAFLLFFIKIENAVYISCQNSALFFINGLILFRNAKETLKEMLAWKCSHRGVANVWRIDFFFDIRLSMYWQNSFVKILSKTGLVGKYL